MILNIFNNNKFAQKLIPPLIVFLIGFLSFFAYIYNNTSLDSVILIAACFNSFFFPFVILLGQCSAILFISLYFQYLPEFIQISFTFEIVTKIILFYMLTLFIYSFFFKKILEKFTINKILNIFIAFGILNVILSFCYFIIIALFNHLQPLIKMLPLNEKLNFYFKSLPYLLKQFNNINIRSIKDLFQYGAMGINSMMLNIRLFINSNIASIFLSIILKDPSNEIFQKFDRSTVNVSNTYKILCFSFLFSSIIMFLLKYNLLGLIFFSIFISFFFLFFIIGRNLLINGLLEKTGNLILSIIIFMLLIQLIPLFPIILIILGFVVSIFNI